jgi:hypothetical protein
MFQLLHIINGQLVVPSVVSGRIVPALFKIQLLLVLLASLHIPFSNLFSLGGHPGGLLGHIALILQLPGIVFDRLGHFLLVLLPLELLQLFLLLTDLLL